MEISIDYLNPEFAFHTVHMLWVTPDEDLLIKRIYWSYGKPILLLGVTFDAPHQVFHQLVYKYTTVWQQLETALINYQPLLDPNINCIHTFEELIEYVGNYSDPCNDAEN